MFPETRYAAPPQGRVAYQVSGRGSVDLLFVPEPPAAVDLLWDNPRSARFLRKLGSFARLIGMDPRGQGASDPVDLEALPTPEQWMDDVRGVLDAAGTQRVVLFGHGASGFACALFAAAYPQRTAGLILFNAFARAPREPEYPAGLPERVIARILQTFPEKWGTGEMLEHVGPSIAQDQGARLLHARLERLSIAPGAMRSMMQFVYGFDYRRVLPSIRVPTLVLHRAGDRYIRPAHGRYLAEHIPQARFVELPGDDHLWYAGDVNPILSEVQEFVTGERAPPEENRILATVMFVDIVDSTRRVAEDGDVLWRELLERFYDQVRQEVGRFQGHEIDTAGDGYFARFDAPTRAVRCAAAVRDAVAAFGLPVRVGLHTGECELIGSKVGGLTVHIGARVAATAAPGDILVSQTVRDLVSGSELRFSDRGVHALKGVPGDWRLYALQS